MDGYLANWITLNYTPNKFALNEQRLNKDHRTINPKYRAITVVVVVIASTQAATLVLQIKSSRRSMASGGVALVSTYSLEKRSHISHVNLSIPKATCGNFITLVDFLELSRTDGKIDR